jgi:PleD family two-component response regulator
LLAIRPGGAAASSTAYRFKTSMPDLWRDAGRDTDDEQMSKEPIVLLADDRSDDRESIAFHLAMAGYPVVQAGSVDKVIEELHRARPDLVVVSDDLDHRLVGDLIALIEDASDPGDVPVITLSDDPGSHRLVECLAGGARDHVRRGAGAEELIARIDAALRTDEELERLRRRNAELEFLGAVDSLTGMANRRGLEEELERLAAGAARHHLALSAVMVRAALPEGAGSPRVRADRVEALRRELGYLVTAVRRTDDLSGVWDQHCFVVLLPLTPLEGARVFAERMRSVVAAAPLRYGDELVPVTLSCGYAEVGPDTSGVLAALEAVVDRVEAAGGDAVSPV